MTEREYTGDVIGDFVRNATDIHAGQLEQLAEQMLTDPRGWGILEHDYGFGWRAELSPLVPFGEHHTHKAERGYPCAGCEHAARSAGEGI